VEFHRISHCATEFVKICCRKMGALMIRCVTLLLLHTIIAGLLLSRNKFQLKPEISCCNFFYIFISCKETECIHHVHSSLSLVNRSLHYFLKMTHFNRTVKTSLLLNNAQTATFHTFNMNIAQMYTKQNVES